MVVAGMAITMLNDMVAALSFIPTFFVRMKKKCHTSYTESPCRPGSVLRRAMLRTNVTGFDCIMRRSSFVTQLLFIWLPAAFSPQGCQELCGTPVHIFRVPQKWR